MAARQTDMEPQENTENIPLQSSSLPSGGYKPPSRPKITPMSQEKNKTRNWAARIDYSWAWNILGLSFALGVLIAIITILRVYDGKEQPSWRYISLNTLLSWLSTIGKGCILFPVSAGLSQLKWVWFAERKRPLSDLRVFDSASRGLYGSAELLWALRMRHFAILGGSAVLLALGFDPFIQNLIDYKSSLVEDSSQASLLANSSVYDELGPLQHGVGSYYIDATLKANVYNAIFNPDPGKPWAIPQYTCPTGNCTWDPVASIAMRALCSNVTSSLTTKCEQAKDIVEYQNCTVSLPNGATAWNSNDQLSQSIVLKVQAPQQPIVYTDAKLPVIQSIYRLGASTVHRNGMSMGNEAYSSMTHVATECTLEPIARSVRVYVGRSIYHEDTLGEWTQAHAWNNSFGSPGYSFLPSWNESQLGVLPNQNFTLFPYSRMTIADFISKLFSGYARASNMEFGFQPLLPPSDLGSYATTDAIQAIFFGNISGCANLENDRFGCVMNNTAAAISKSFRDQAFSRNPQTAKNNMSVGHTMTSTVLVCIHWQWLTLPLLIWVLSAVTWLGTEWKTRRARLEKWIDNPLPLLFLYRSESDSSHGDEVKEGISGEAYVRRAEMIQARLHMRENQAAFI